MNIDNDTKEQLVQLIEQVETLEDQKQGVQENIKDVYSVAKSRGFDTKTMRKIVRLRKVSREKRQEEEMLLDTYAVAVGLAE